MKIVGQPTITKYILNEDGSLSEPIFKKTYNNIITKRVMTEYFSVTQDNTQIFNNTFKIAVSLQSTSPDYEAITLGMINAVGDPTLVPVGFEFKDRDGIDPTQVIYSNRFLPPAATRTINSLGIVTGATLVDDPGATTVRDNYTYLVLGVPVMQANNEVLDISYKIFVDWQNNPYESNLAWQRRVEWRLFYPGATNSESGSFQGIDHTMPISFIPNGFTAYYGKATDVTYSYFAGTDVDPITFTNDPPPFAGSTNNPAYGDVEYGRTAFYMGNSLTGTFGQDILSNYRLGRFTRSILFGEPKDSYNADSTADSSWPAQNFGTTSAPDYNDWAGETLFTKTSDLSNVFSHSETAITPMYNVNDLANSSLKPVVTNSVPEVDFPSEYILHVTLAGGYGVGEYKLFKAGFGGWNGNTLNKPLFEPITTFSADTNYVLSPTQEELIFNHRWIYEWVNTKGDYQFWSYVKESGLARWQVTPTAGAVETKRYLNTTYTQFNGVINDLAVDPATDKVYIATEGGLYEMVVTTDTLTQLDPDACASVVVGDSNQVFAIFRDGAGSGRLSSSIGANWTVALDLTGATINWDNVWRIFIDPTSTDYDLMFYEGYTPKHTPVTGTATLPITDYVKIHWWDNVSKWIKTDAFDAIDLASGTPSTTNWVSYELHYLPHNDAVQVTNGLWMYPTNAFLAGDAVLKSASTSIYPRITNRERYSSYLMDFRWDCLTTTPTLKWSSSAGASLGWNLEDGTATDVTSYVVIDSKRYAWALHAAVPFITHDFDCTPTQIIQGKPNPGDTIYDICFVTGFYGTLSSTNTAESSLPFRTPWMFKVSIDEGGVSSVKDYALDDSSNYIFSYRDVPELGYNMLANYRVTTDKRLMWFLSPTISRSYLGDTIIEPPGIDTRMPFHPNKWNGGIGFAGLHVKNIEDVADLFIQAFEWTGAAWIADPLNTGPGKPVHAGSEALIDGLFVQWDELQISNPQPLVLDQWYNFVKNSEPNTILGETTAPNIETYWDVYLRDIVSGTDSGTIPVGLNLNLPESPTGTAPDTLWLSLPPDYIGTGFSATINGSPVDIFVDPSTTPPAGVIHVTNPATGEIYFAAADSGQPFVFNYIYLRKYDTSEVL